MEKNTLCLGCRRCSQRCHIGELEDHSALGNLSHARKASGRQAYLHFGHTKEIMLGRKNKALIRQTVDWRDTRSSHAAFDTSDKAVATHLAGGTDAERAPRILLVG